MDVKAFLFTLMLATQLCAGDFVTSYWYGPPPKFTSIEHYRRIKEANFNVVFPPGPPDTSITREQNFLILDFCRELELKAVIFDPRMPRTLAAADAKAKIDAVVADYAAHPALLAYFIADEPGAGDFAALGDVVEHLKRRDPKHPGYINLFPAYAAPWAQLGAETYEKYVDQFVKRVDPFVISYDHYAFFKTNDRPDFFTNLAIIRNASLASRRPFWNIAQLTQHYDYRPLTEPELRFQAMQTLAFGGRGLLWYTYWYPGSPDPIVAHAMIDHDGEPTPEYQWIKSINADARAIGDALFACESWAVFHVGEGAQYPAPAGSPIVVDQTSKLTIGLFRTTSGGQTLALVTNRDYGKAAQPRVRVEPPGVRVEQFDPSKRAWSPRGFDADSRLRFELPPGGALLLRWPER